MPRKLKLQKKFVPCITEDGDEIFRNGIFHFNITKMIDYLKQENSGISIEEIDISGLFIQSSSIGQQHLDHVNLEKPIILAETAPEKYNLIDGNHRVAKARIDGIYSLPGYRVNVLHHIKFLTTTQAYSSYIEYWNGKCNGK